MAENAPDKASKMPEVKPPVAPKFYKVIPFQMSRDDGTGSFRHGEWVLASEFSASELERLVKIGALVPVPAPSAAA